MSRTARRGALLCLALAASLLLDSAHAEDPSYGVWVFLHEHAAASTLPPAVSDDVIAARGLLPTDRPVDPAIIAQLEENGAHIRYASRWLRAVAVDANARTIRRLARLDAVRAMSPIRRGYSASAPDSEFKIRNSESEVEGSVPAVQPDSAHYGALYPALRELNIPVLHDMGFTGAGVRIAILDTGFDPDHEALAHADVVATRDFVNGDEDVTTEPSDPTFPDPEQHGTQVWSLAAANRPGLMVAGAFDAAYILAKVDIPAIDTQGDEDRWVAAVEWADSLDADIINSSVGFRDNFTDRPPIPLGSLDGNTTVTTRMADEAARRGILVVVAIGNGGPTSYTLWAPADADSVISVGGIDSLTSNRRPIPLDSSARGPTGNNVLKPELAARGANLIAASHVGRTVYDRNIRGSSFAAPLITGAAAVFMHAWAGQPAFDLSNMTVRRALMLAGTNAREPDVVVGFGVPDVASAVMFPVGLDATSVGATDLEGRLTTIGPTFLWNAPLVHPRFRPITYRVEVSTDSLFAKSIAYSEPVSDAFAHTARRPIRPMSGYWRVVATSPQGVRRATAPQPFTMPDWVTLLTLNGTAPTFISESRPTLEWRPLAAPEPLGVFEYDVEVLSLSGEVVQRMESLTGTSSVRVPSVLAPNESYRWRVIARARDNTADTVTSAQPFVIISDERPPTTLLYNPFPNPLRNFFGGRGLSIWFDLADDADVELAIYDSRARLVRRLIPGRPDCGTVRLPAGQYGRSGQVFTGLDDGCALTLWDGRMEDGSPAPRGVYMLRLRAGGDTDTKRFILLPNE